MTEQADLASRLAEERAREAGYGVPGADPASLARAEVPEEEDEEEAVEEGGEEEEAEALARAAAEDEEPRRDPHTRTCETCNGYGQTLTGSRVEAFATRQCPTCQGLGYVEILPEPPPPPPPAPPEAGPAPWPEPPPPATPYAPLQTW